MGVFSWLRRNQRPAGLKRWHERWTAAAGARDVSAARALQADLESLGLAEEDVEVEREMIQALDDLALVLAAMREAGLPIVETGHRVVGSDRCHFIATASLPEHAAQPAGRVFLTEARAIFAGGSTSVAMPWHAVAQMTSIDRDVLLVRTGGDALHRFRFNTYSDALVAAVLASELRDAARRGGRL
jgi:hypothetical protein